MRRRGSVPACTHLLKNKRKCDGCIAGGVFSKQDCEFPVLFEVQKKMEQGICDDLFFQVSVMFIEARHYAG